MLKKVYLFALAGLLGLSACQRATVGGFQASHTESFARSETRPAAQVVAPLAEPAPAVAASNPLAVAPASGAAEQAVAPAATPAQAAQVTDQLVASAKGTRYEARTLKIKAALEKATAQNQLNAAPRKMTLAEKAMTKLVTKKVSKQIKEAHATQRLDSNVGLGILFLAVALILALLSVGNIYVVIAAVLGVAFLLIGLLNQAAS